MKQSFDHTHTKGFAMLFTVLIVGIILSIGIGISNITLKQTILSSLAKDSQTAFYQADGAIECGLYYDITAVLFPRGVAVASVPSILPCGNKSFALDVSASQVNYFVYRESISDTNNPCVILIFDKLSSGTQTTIQSRGYNICRVAPRQVERILQSTY